MIKLGVARVIFCSFLLGGIVRGQGSAPATLEPRTKNQAVDKATPVKSPSEKPPSENDPAGKPGDAKKTAAQEPIVTEIYADKTVFDSAKSIGIFTGHIVVTDPRFSIQGDKLTIYLGQKQDDGFEKAVVEGNVGVVRDRPNTGGGPPDRMVGRSEKAVYTAKDGRFELTGNPRVQQGLNTHVATSPETVMILNEAGQLETHGPSRTEIRQEPNAEKTPPKP
jgi:lipopolysaccharide transport protein LptA